MNNLGLKSGDSHNGSERIGDGGSVTARADRDRGQVVTINFCLPGIHLEPHANSLDRGGPLRTYT